MPRDHGREHASSGPISDVAVAICVATAGIVLCLAIAVFAILGRRDHIDSACTIETALQLRGGVVVFGRNGRWWHGFVQSSGSRGGEAGPPVLLTRWTEGPPPELAERRWAVPLDIAVPWDGPRPTPDDRIGVYPADCRR